MGLPALPEPNGPRCRTYGLILGLMPARQSSNMSTCRDDTPPLHSLLEMKPQQRGCAMQITRCLAQNSHNATLRWIVSARKTYHYGTNVPHHQGRAAYSKTRVNSVRPIHRQDQKWFYASSNAKNAATKCGLVHIIAENAVRRRQYTTKKTCWRWLQ